MNFKIFILLIVLFSINLFANSDEYFQIDEYVAKTNQEIISKEFRKNVHNNAKAISKQKETIKIVMVYPADQISDYWRKSKISFEKRMNELNINYKLVNFFTKPAVQINRQSKHLLKALKENADYLIFTLDAKKHKKFIERIIAKNRTKLILQNITTPLKKWGSKQPFLYVGFDHFVGSKYLADYFISKTKGVGNYAVLYGSKGYVSFMRGEKTIDYISSKSNLKLIHEYYTDFDKEKAKKATEDLLDINDDIKFIYTCSTDIALGVIEVLKERNLLGKIEVNGWGGGNSELDAIEKGELDITVMRMNDDNGVAMAEAIKLDLENKSNLVPTIYSGTFTIVKKGIVKKELKKLRKRAFRYTLNE